MKSSISAHCRFWLVLILVSAAPCFADEVATPAYTLEVVAPSPVKEAVLQSLDLTRWQSYTGITPEFFELLLAEARTQARGAAETEGYFSAKIDSDVDKSTTPMTVRIRIELGQPTMVTAGFAHRDRRGNADTRRRCADQCPEVGMVVADRNDIPPGSVGGGQEFGRSGAEPSIATPLRG